MRKIVSISMLIAATLLLNSCQNSEEQKIMDDLDLEVNEFLENNPESGINNIWEEKDWNKMEENSDKKNNKTEDKEAEKEVNKESNKESSTGSIDEFAQCITKNWARMYWTDWCVHCKNQKKMFGDAMKNVNFIDCDKERQACKTAWITWYPTWIIWWEQFPWVQTFELLWEKTWCKLVK